ncbi:hypothetical protein MMC10_006848 [Thelotrema lepadinum]|nr:hypothetical protein [Thelotrema lepadinum]
MPSPQFNIRPASLSPSSRDAAGINAIQTHYILNSKKTIYYTPFSVDETAAKISAAWEKGYLCLVAVSTSIDKNSIVEGEVLGYISISPFRPQQGWTPTAELSLFVAPGHTKCGIGSALLRRAIGIMRDEGEHRDYVRLACGKEGAVKGDGKGEVERRERELEGMRVKNIVAVLVVDEDDLVYWYERFGFRLVGIMEEAGEKGGER